MIILRMQFIFLNIVYIYIFDEYISISDTMELKKDFFQYLSTTSIDESWGMVCTTAGYQNIPANSQYPLSSHPINYSFKSVGRTLNEYQLVYIIKGSGYFTSSSCLMTRVSAGTMILLFPGEWHLYYPDEQSGWYEYWVGFKGINMDQRVLNGFFKKTNPLFQIGISSIIINQYEDIFRIIKSQKNGFQQPISGLILSILGNVYYEHQNKSELHNPAIDKINQACSIMRENIDGSLPPAEIAQMLNISYTWFRQMFKQYTGTSPNQYQLHIKHIKAKELLINSSLSISEIAYKLGFENISQFSTFFKSKEGATPSDFRKISTFDYKES